MNFLTGFENVLEHGYSGTGSSDKEEVSELLFDVWLDLRSDY